jgi:hypothetical protein
MLRFSFALAGVLIVAGAVSGFAQEPKMEVSAFGGWSFADGVSGATFIAPDGSAYNRIDPKDSALFGFSGGFLLGEEKKAEVGFMFSRMNSSFVVGGALGTPDRELGGFHIQNYHGYFGYNFGEAEAKLKPFIYGGLGATNFASVEFTDTFGVRRSTNGNAQFSTTWGGGVKYFFNPKIGVRGGASWTPVYIKSDATGYWCDPWWGCYVVGDAQYSNQFHLTGGVTFRF